MYTDSVLSDVPYEVNFRKIFKRISSQYSDSLRAGRSGHRIPWRAIFSAPVKNGPVTHPASSKLGTGSFPELKRPGRGVDYPPPSSAEVKERVGLYIFSLSGLLWPVLRQTLPTILQRVKCL